ncbi:MAG TPA: lipoyl synthase [Acidobacteriota bacterium]|nr:lipoyl synthase [Acidobacteriota bacterium]
MEAKSNPLRIIGNQSPAASRRPRPDWLKVRLPQGENYFHLRSLVRDLRLNTVCEDARCPNIGECWGAGTATLMILGEVCTRACKFCAVKTGRPPEYDLDEPRRAAAAIAELHLKYAVITSVDRDDLEDGGAYIFAETIRLTREACPGIRIEVLIPDFRGSRESLGKVVLARPDVLAHNIETVPRLYPVARAGSRYRRSLDHLKSAKTFGIDLRTKSSIMVGLGERRGEILEALDDLRAAEVDIVTLGQYLQPTSEHLPVERFYAPDEFAAFREYGMSLGFSHVEAGPLVRSSYHAEKQAAALVKPAALST